MVFYALFAVCSAVSVGYGNGQRFSDLDPEQMKLALMNWWLSQGGYALACVTAKVSICIFLTRIAIKRIHVWILRVVAVAALVMGVVLCFILLLQCNPVSFFWDRTGDGTCISMDHTTGAFYGYSVISAICDFTIGILPIFLIWNMQANKKTKLAIAGILGMACIASTAVVVRIPFIETYREKDFLYATTPISICSHLEAGLGISAANLPTLRPLFRFSRVDATPSPNRRRSSYNQVPSYGRSGKKGRRTDTYNMTIDDGTVATKMGDEIPLGHHGQNHNEHPGDAKQAASAHTTQEALVESTAYSPV
ncbi:hypothetical protein FQN54_009298 [Arachnomyces sp. PD_36]|nr:hypothetical protein FQN54_009298 [Arachnomyces sp. PD_36]